ncbi:hypothetical protein [Microbacterium rhizophilus]|uniref:hypothetical protein n=1 Tax=Microbacterium rhizophilus TaxID=3138934 RepID=UPI0031F1A77D
MRVARPAAVAAGILALALALAGCRGDDGETPPPPAAPEADASRWDPDSGDNGLWLLSGPSAIAQIVRAMRDAGPVTVKGEVTELVTPEDAQQDPFPGRRIAVDYAGEYGHLRAAVDAGDVSIEVVMTDGRAYVRGNAALAERTGVAAFRKGWVCTTSPDVLLGDWAPLLEPAALVETLASGAEEFAVMEPEPGAETTEAVIGASESPFGTLTVASVGPPLPQAFLAGDVSGDGSFTFGDWGTSPEIAVPTDVSQPCD